MRIKFSALFAVGLMAMVCLAQDTRPKPTFADQPLTAEQAAVYRAVLTDYMKYHDGPLNVAGTTEPFGFNGLIFDTACAAEIGLDKPTADLPAGRRLDRLAFEDSRIRWVKAEEQMATIRQNEPRDLTRKAARDGKTLTSADWEKWRQQSLAMGMLSLSEITFDAAHRHAAVSYAFYCAGMCGHGSMVILEKVEEEWKVGTPCAAWVV